MVRQPDLRCPIARSLSVLGERWTFLIVRQAVLGTRRFNQFQNILGMSPDILTARLSTLVDNGILERAQYHEAGSRPRDEYQLTDVGRQLAVVLGALQQWGDEHLPWPEKSLVSWHQAGSNRPVRVAFVDEAGREIPNAEVVAVLSSEHDASPSVAGREGARADQRRDPV